MEKGATKVRAPLFPTYSELRLLLTLWEGVPRVAVAGMINAIHEQTGTPQNPVDWTDPDAWIGERLSGGEAELACRIWEESERTVNPRHVNGSYLFVNSYGLLVADAQGVYRLTETGRNFLDGNSEVVRRIDEAEGLPQLLAILATKTRAKRADLLPEWGEFLREYSNFGTPSTIKDTLRRRLVNLVERGMVSREGNAYVITPEGVEYASAPSGEGNDNRRREVVRAISAHNSDQREALRARLGKMHPYAFERLVRELLEAMGYEDVAVTKQSGDKGVDVVAKVQFGITTIKEVVQVKRHQGGIGRPVLDQLRGALPYHGAIRGTIFTLGKFSKGCEDAALFPGAAPIGLIDGDRLLELLIEHEVGIQKRPATLYKLDESYFGAVLEEELAEAPSVEQAAGEENHVTPGYGRKG